MANIPESQRYLCQFREAGKTYMVTGCGFPTQIQAANYVDAVYEALDTTEEAQVLDGWEEKIVYHRGWYEPAKDIKP